MQTLNLADILRALRETDPDELAAALYADRDPRILAALVDTVAHAAEQRAFYPHPDVIAAGDAALYTVLTWSIADALTHGRSLPTAEQLAATQGTDSARAQALLDRITATETLAAQQLIDSGVEITFTAEQICVDTAIRALLAEGTTPTREAVRTYATNRAALTMRDGRPPIVDNDAGLPPRILSASPYARVPRWIDRMDAAPPGPRLLDDELRYVDKAWSAMRRSARARMRLEQSASAPPPRFRSVAEAAVPTGIGG